jgi:hypothetical protein
MEEWKEWLSFLSIRAGSLLSSLPDEEGKLQS